jgi:hypothetical protein
MFANRGGSNMNRLSKRHNLELNYVFDHGTLLQIDKSHEVINRWSISSVPPEVVIDALATLHDDDALPDYLLTHSERLSFLVDLLTCGTALQLRRTQHFKQRIARRVSYRAQSYLIDALSNSMDLYEEDQFVEWLTKHSDMSPDAIAKIYQSYWLLDPLERDGYNDGEWLRWLEQTIDLR